MDSNTCASRLITSIIGIGTAFFLWYLVFLTDFLGNFWYRMGISVTILIVYVTLIDKRQMIVELKARRLHHLGLGIISALILYILFLTGFMLMRPILEEGARLMYRYKFETASGLIAILLLFTSFGEEYFWRGFLQRRLCEKYGPLGITLTTVAYTLVHVPTFNVTLMSAALVAGLYWGVLYFKFRSLWAVIVSHIVWTELIFVFLPL